MKGKESHSRRRAPHSQKGDSLFLRCEWRRAGAGWGGGRGHLQVRPLASEREGQHTLALHRLCIGPRVKITEWERFQQ